MKSKLKQMALMTMVAVVLLVGCGGGGGGGVGSDAHANVYYVDTSGNDVHQGTASMPWRTMQKCADTIQGGDTCILREGEYTENVTLNRKGSEGNFIELKSEVKHKAIIKGEITLTNTSGYIKIDGLKIVLPDGYQSGISINGNFNQVKNNYVTTSSTSLGSNNTAIRAGGNNHVVENNYVEKVCFGYELSGRGHRFSGNEATKLKLNGSCGDVDYMRFFGANHMIDNNYFHDINMSEVGQAHVDCFQTFDDIGEDSSISNVVIERNVCVNAAQGIMAEGVRYLKSSGLTIRNNVFTRNGAWCAIAKDIANVHYYNNTCDTTGGIHGLWCSGVNHVGSCEFKNNIIYGTGTMYGVMETASLIDGTTGAPGKNNLLFNPNQTIAGYDNDIKNRNPLFVGGDYLNYRITESSPAVNAGLNIIQWGNPTDILGVARPQGLYWDIGAYEYQQ